MTNPTSGPAPSPCPAGITSTTSHAPRVVLDSNIWVDILVFGDPHARPILAALEAGAIAPVIRADCREELRRVLAYPQFARFAVDIDAALATVDRFSTLEPLPTQEDADAIRLPRCKDTDDQKFVELAHFPAPPAWCRRTRPCSSSGAACAARAASK